VVETCTISLLTQQKAKSMVICEFNMGHEEGFLFPFFAIFPYNFEARYHFPPDLDRFLYLASNLSVMGPIVDLYFIWDGISNELGPSHSP